MNKGGGTWAGPGRAACVPALRGSLRCQDGPRVEAAPGLHVTKAAGTASRAAAAGVAIPAGLAWPGHGAALRGHRAVFVLARSARRPLGAWQPGQGLLVAIETASSPAAGTLPSGSDAPAPFSTAY